MRIHQDVRLYAALARARRARRATLSRPGRHAWVQVARGRVSLGATALAAGDGAALTDEAAVELAAEEPSELLVFDLA